MTLSPISFIIYFSLGVVGCLLGAGYAAKEENGGKFFGHLFMAAFDAWAIYSMFEILKTCK
jgi:hypothetical protein